MGTETMWGDHVTTEAEMGAMRPQAQDGQGPRVASRVRKGGGKTQRPAWPTPPFGAFSLLSRDGMPIACAGGRRGTLMPKAGLLAGGRSRSPEASEARLARRFADPPALDGSTGGRERPPRVSTQGGWACPRGRAGQTQNSSVWFLPRRAAVVSVWHTSRRRQAGALRSFTGVSGPHRAQHGEHAHRPASPGAWRVLLRGPVGMPHAL